MTTSAANVLGLGRSDLNSMLTTLGQKSFRVGQLMRWLYHQDIHSFHSMTDVPLSLRERLSEQLSIELPKVISKQVSSDGTTKWSIASGNNQVEMVLIPEPDRRTLCVSSQAGCALKCSFCATGKQGFAGNLSAAEIVGQLCIANRYLIDKGESKVSNVVFMGMGEPLLNLDAVLQAAQIMMDDWGFGLSKRRTTVSTAGVVPNIYKLADNSDVSLAISLHAPNDALRSVLVPINKKYPIKDLMDACFYYLSVQSARRFITFEYTLIKGVNDSLECAKQLCDLLKSIRCKVNLIPFNTFSEVSYKTPSEHTMKRFKEYLSEKGIVVTLRRTRGADIDAACGQLAGAVKKKSKSMRVVMK